MKRPPKLPPEKRRLLLAAAMLVAAAFLALSQPAATAPGGRLARLASTLGGS
jgi:hypothetical protein